jgi:hypothetical protein
MCLEPPGQTGAPVDPGALPLTEQVPSLPPQISHPAGEVPGHS